MKKIILTTITVLSTAALVACSSPRTDLPEYSDNTSTIYTNHINSVLSDINIQSELTNGYFVLATDVLGVKVSYTSSNPTAINVTSGYFKVNQSIIDQNVDITATATYEGQTINKKLTTVVLAGVGSDVEDGTTPEAPSVTLPDNPIFISEYYEGTTGNWSYLELYNPTDTKVSLEEYEIRLGYSSADPYESSVVTSLKGYEIDANSCLIVYSDKAPDELVDALKYFNSIPGEMYHNGDDTYGLYYSDILVDSFGDVGTTTTSSVGYPTEDGGSSVNHRLIRNPGVTGNTSWDPSEWTSQAVTNTETYLENASVHEFVEGNLPNVVYPDVYYIDQMLSLISFEYMYEDDFELLLTGDNVSVSWESTNEEIISIDGSIASVVRPDVDTEVTLVANIICNDTIVSQEYVVCIKRGMNENEVKQEVLDLLSLKEEVTNDFALVTNSSGYDIIWSSSDVSTISIDGKAARVTRGLSDVTVTITASIDDVSKTFTVKVLSSTNETIIPTDINIFISEYYEGMTSNWSYLELYNPTSNKVSLDGYQINLGYSGTDPISSSNITYLDGRTIDAYSCLIIYNENTTVEFESNFTYFNSMPGKIYHNGDDTYGIYYNDVLVDLFGEVGTKPGTSSGGGYIVDDGGSSLNHRLIRNPGVTGNTSWNPSEWTSQAVTTTNTYFENASVHEFVEGNLPDVVYPDTYYIDQVLTTISFDSLYENNFDLIISGNNDVTISWVSSDTSVVSINGTTAVVTRPDSDVDLTLTATFKRNNTEITKDYSITIKRKMTESELIKEVFDTLDVQSEATSDFNLITERFNQIIEWSSDTESSIEIVDGVAVVTRGEFDVDVTLTASITCGSTTETKQFVVKVLEESASEVVPTNVDIFISESYEPNKANWANGYIELYNPLSFEVKLEGYVLYAAYGSDPLASGNLKYSVDLSSLTIGANGCLIIYSSAAETGFATYYASLNSISQTSYKNSGKVNYALYNGDTLIDVFGLESNGGWPVGNLTTENSIVSRNPGEYGSAEWNPEQWTAITSPDSNKVVSDLYDYIGVHTFTETQSVVVTLLKVILPTKEEDLML